jgi:hypothetical protein
MTDTEGALDAQLPDSIPLQPGPRVLATLGPWYKYESTHLICFVVGRTSRTLFQCKVWQPNKCGKPRRLSDERSHFWFLLP